MLGEDVGRHQGDASTSQGTPKIASKPPEAKGEARDRFSLTALRRNQTWRILDLGLPASRTGRHSISVVQVTQFVVLCYSRSSKLIQCPTRV